MVTLPDSVTYWRYIGASDSDWNVDTDGVFTPDANSTVEVGSRSLSEPSYITVAALDAWWVTGAYADLDYENDRAYINGIAYASIAAARSAGALVQTGGIDRMPLPALAASYALAAKGVTGSTKPVEGSPKYLVALDDGADGVAIDELIALDWATITSVAYANIIMYSSSSALLLPAPDATTSRTKAASSACRMGVRVKSGAHILSIDGVKTATGSSAAKPTVTQLVIGNREDGTRAWSGTIKRICFVNAEIDETALNALLA